MRQANEIAITQRLTPATLKATVTGGASAPIQGLRLIATRLA